jgi:replicative DNA helicase
MGKSAIMMNIGLNVAKKQKVCFMSFEMSEEEITKNVISNQI